MSNGITGKLAVANSSTAQAKVGVVEVRGISGGDWAWQPTIVFVIG
jgi:hypothetical protein